MTQSITSNIMNNIPDIFAKDCGMDKSADFGKVFDKSMSIGDMKNARLEKVQKLSDFKEVLGQASSEVNVESSLDLTLARDINEIISDLKKATDNIEQDEENAIIGDLSVFQQLLNPNSEAEAAGNVQLSQAPALEFANPEAKMKEELLEDTESALEEDIVRDLNIESVEVETDSSNEDSSLMNNQTPQEQAVKVMLNTEAESFEIKMPEQPVQDASKSVSANPDKLIEQIAKQMESLQSGSKVNIVLNPESLGKVNIQLINTKEGLSAQFTVSTQEAKELLMKGLDGLKETLTAQGVGVDNVSVKVNDTQNSEYNSDWTEQEGSRGGNKHQGESQKEEKEKGLFEKMMAQQSEKE